jgi:hypothetical protein
MTWVSVTVGVTCAMLVILTVVSNLRPIWETRISGSTLFLALARVGLIPTWHFFAPTPSVFSFFIFYREFYGSNTYSDWRQLPQPFSRNKFASFIINPTSRYYKTIIDMAVELALNQNSKGSECFSNSYLHVLQHISDLHKSQFAKGLQFCVAANKKDRTVDIAYLSRVHECTT